MTLVIEKGNEKIKEVKNVDILPNIGDNIYIPDLGMVIVVKKFFTVCKKISKINIYDEMVCFVDVEVI